MDLRCCPRGEEGVVGVVVLGDVREAVHFGFAGVPGEGLGDGEGHFCLFVDGFDVGVLRMGSGIYQIGL